MPELRYCSLRSQLKISALGKAGGEHLRLPTQPADGGSEFPAQLVEVPAAAVGQLDPLEVIPHAFVRIEVRRVARQLD